MVERKNVENWQMNGMRGGTLMGGRVGVQRWRCMLLMVLVVSCCVVVVVAVVVVVWL